MSSWGFKRTYNRWTEEEDDLMRREYRERGARGMVKLLPRHPNYSAIGHRARKLGLTTVVGPYGRRREEV